MRPVATGSCAHPVILRRHGPWPLDSLVAGRSRSPVRAAAVPLFRSRSVGSVATPRPVEGCWFQGPWEPRSPRCRDGLAAKAPWSQGTRPPVRRSDPGPRVMPVPCSPDRPGTREPRSRIDHGPAGSKVTAAHGAWQHPGTSSPWSPGRPGPRGAWLLAGRRRGEDQARAGDAPAVAPSDQGIMAASKPGDHASDETRGPCRMHDLCTGAAMSPGTDVSCNHGNIATLVRQEPRCLGPQVTKVRMMP